MTAILRRIDATVEPVAALLMGVMPLIVFLGVVYRYVLLSPLPWVEEVVRLCLVWVSFLGAYLAMRRGQHIAMGVVRARLRDRVRRTTDGLGLALLAAFLVVLVWYGARYARAFWTAPTPYLGLPMGLVYAALPLAALLLLLSIVSSLLQVGRRPADGARAES